MSRLIVSFYYIDARREDGVVVGYKPDDAVSSVLYVSFRSPLRLAAPRRAPLASPRSASLLPPPLSLLTPRCILLPIVLAAADHPGNHPLPACAGPLLRGATSDR